MSIANRGAAFATFLLFATIVLVGPAIGLHYAIADWNPYYIPHAVYYGTLFSAGWPSWIATAITLMAVVLALRFAARSTRLHVRGKQAGVGGHPLLAIFGSGIVILALYVGLAAATLATEWIALAIVFAIATIVGFFLAGIYGGLMIAAILNARVQLRPAIEAVEAGLTPSVVAGDVTGNGICILDTDNRKLFAGGATHGFDEVSSLGWANEKNLAKIKIALKSGDTPVKTIGYQSQSQRDQDLQRLSNALGMS